MVEAPSSTDLEQAIRDFLLRWLAFVPDVQIRGLYRIVGISDAVHTHSAELFLSYRYSQEGASADALEEALNRLRCGFERGEILGGRFKHLALNAQTPAMFNEYRQLVVLAANLRFAV